MAARARKAGKALADEGSTGIMAPLAVLRGRSVRTRTVIFAAAVFVVLAAAVAFGVLRRIADAHGKRLEMQRTLAQLQEMIRQSQADAPAKADDLAADGAKPSLETPNAENAISTPADMSPEEARAAVERAISEHPVVVFSKSYCPYCKRAKDTLGTRAADAPAAGSPYVVELDELAGDAGRAMQDALREMTGQGTVPNVFIRGQHVGGSDRVAELDAANRLVPVLRGESLLS